MRGEDQASHNETDVLDTFLGLQANSCESDEFCSFSGVPEDWPQNFSIEDLNKQFKTRVGIDTDLTG